jgi:hypothetical protein
VVVDYYTKSGGGRPKGSTKVSMTAKKAALLSAKTKLQTCVIWSNRRQTTKGAV